MRLSTALVVGALASTLLPTSAPALDFTATCAQAETWSYGRFRRTGPGGDRLERGPDVILNRSGWVITVASSRGLAFVDGRPATLLQSANGTAVVQQAGGTSAAFSVTTWLINIDAGIVYRSSGSVENLLDAGATVMTTEMSCSFRPL